MVFTAIWECCACYIVIVVVVVVVVTKVTTAFAKVTITLMFETPKIWRWQLFNIHRLRIYGYTETLFRLHPGGHKIPPTWIISPSKNLGLLQAGVKPRLWRQRTDRQTFRLHIAWPFPAYSMPAHAPSPRKWMIWDSGFLNYR